MLTISEVTPLSLWRMWRLAGRHGTENKEKERQRHRDWDPGPQQVSFFSGRLHILIMTLDDEVLSIWVICLFLVSCQKLLACY